jgi:radical SAM superfamily enzyme YgiQ (UPF0313 family)
LKILIVSTNRNRQPFPVLPFGACIAAEGAERAGHTVRMLDLMFSRDPLAAVACETRAMRPDIAGISIRNIDSNDIMRPELLLEGARSVVDTLRKESGARIIVGGAAATVMPGQILRYTGGDEIVAGNGETVFPALLDALARGNDPRKVEGAGWLENDVFVQSDPASPSPPDRWIAPDFHRWLDMRSYRSGMAAVPLQTKRGCPFDCVYCTYSAGEGRGYCFRDPGKVVESIGACLARGWRDMEFVDNVFNSPREQAVEICRSIAASGLKPRLQTLELNPKFIDDDLLSAMEAAGFTGIGVTAESASDEVLRGLGKNFTAADVRNAADTVRRHRVPCVWIFMLGGPGETRDTARETIAFAESCLRTTDAAFFNIGIRIYPGTPLERIAREEGMLTATPDKMLAPVFYVSPKVDTKWLVEEIGRAADRNMQFIGQDTFSLPWLSALLGMLSRFGVDQPVWRHTGRLRRGLRFLGVRA